MSKTFAVKNVLTEKEFDGLWALNDRLSRLERISIREIASQAMGGPADVHTAVTAHARDITLAQAASDIVINTFSSADQCDQTNYTEARGKVSKHTFTIFGIAFNQVCGHENRTPSIILPIAKLLTAVVNHGGSSVIDAKTLNDLIAPHILMDPHTIQSPVEYHLTPTDDERQMATDVFDDLIRTLFGVETRPYTPGQTQDKKKHPFLTPEILERAVKVAGNIDTSYHHRQRMIRFLKGCEKARSDIFHTDRLRQAFQDQRTPLDRLAHKAEEISGELFAVSPKFTL